MGPQPRARLLVPWKAPDVLKVGDTRELQAAVLAMKAADRELKKRIDTATRTTMNPVWRDQVKANLAGERGLSDRVLGAGVRIKTGNPPQREQRSQRREALGQVRMEVTTGGSSGKIVAELDKVSKRFLDRDGNERVVLRDVSTTILRGDKLGLIGPNGAGKTTLLKVILGELEPDSGTVRRGSNLTVAYFDQMREQIDLDASLEDFISPGSEWIEIGSRRTHVKSYLGDFLFSPARATAPVRTLSGGERNRLLLARLFARPANVLVLDEPTNDLDIDTLELLEDLLQQYEGTVFLVSHDRRFLNNVVTSTLVAEGDGSWREYVGDVEDWLTQSARARLATEAAAKVTPPREPAAPSPAASPAAPRRKLSYKEQRELDALPARLAALEQEQAELDRLLADGQIYASDPARAAQLASRHAEVEEEWLAAMERHEALSQRA